MIFFPPHPPLPHGVFKYDKTSGVGRHDGPWIELPECQIARLDGPETRRAGPDAAI